MNLPIHPTQQPDERLPRMYSPRLRLHMCELRPISMWMPRVALGMTLLCFGTAWMAIYMMTKNAPENEAQIGSLCSNLPSEGAVHRGVLESNDPVCTADQIPATAPLTPIGHNAPKANFNHFQAGQQLPLPIFVMPYLPSRAPEAMDAPHPQSDSPTITYQEFHSMLRFGCFPIIMRIETRSGRKGTKWSRCRCLGTPERLTVAITSRATILKMRLQ